ncbi:hypothetical protein GCM10008904_32710 [Paraclostridium ghonii]
MRLEKSFLILTTMLKGVKNSLHNKIKKYFIIISIIVPFFLLLGTVISYKIFSPIISAIISGNKSMFFSFISSGMLNVSLITFVVYIIMINSDNDSSNYSKMIKWLPLTKQEKICAQTLQELFFVIITNLCYVMFFHLPSFIGSKVSIKIIIVYLISIIIQSLLIYFLLNTIYLLIIRLLYFVSHKKFIRELASIILGINSFIYLVSKINLDNLVIKSETYKVSIVNILLPVIDMFVGYEFFNYKDARICLAISGVILFLGILITIMFAGIELDNRNLMLFKYIPKSKGKFLWIITKEIKHILRSETNISNLFVLICIIISIGFLDPKTIDKTISNLILSSFCSIFALSSFGEDRNFIIYSNIVPVSSKLISYGKLIGNLIVGISVYSMLYLVIFTYLGMDLQLFKNGLLYTTMGVIVIYTYGIVVPVREKEPFSNIIVFLSFAAIGILISIISLTFSGAYIYELISISVGIIILIIPKLYKLNSKLD